MGDAYENIYGSRLLRVAEGAVVLDVGGESTGFDIDTGVQTWTRSLPDCGETLDPSLGGVVTRIRKDCSLSRILSSELVAADGEVLARTDVAVAHYLDLDRPADPEVPVLLGDSAYDRATGAKLWSSADLVSAPIVPGSGRTAPNDTSGTASAIVGDVALLRDSVRQTEGGLDLRTGRRLWERPITAGQRVAAAVGTVAVSAYDNALIGLDVRTGDEVWRIALDAVVSTDDPFATSGTVGEADDRVLFMTKDRLGGFRTP